MSAQENEAIGFDATFYLPTELKKMFAQFRVRPCGQDRRTRRVCS